MNTSFDKNQIKEFLEEKYKLYAIPKFTNDDPIQIPHRYSRKEDIEIAGLLTATISWGNRKMIIGNMDRLLQKIGDSPYEFVANYSRNDNHLLEGFVHRTFNGLDCIGYVKVLKEIYTQRNGLQELFTNGYNKDKRIKSAIEQFRTAFVEYGASSHMLKHVPNAAKGSACKRINISFRVIKVAN